MSEKRFQIPTASGEVVEAVIRDPYPSDAWSAAARRLQEACATSGTAFRRLAEALDCPEFRDLDDPGDPLK